MMISLLRWSHTQKSMFQIIYPQATGLNPPHFPIKSKKAFFGVACTTHESEEVWKKTTKLE